MSGAPQGTSDGSGAARARSLGAALAELGVAAAVEPRERLAVLRAAPGALAGLHEGARRREVVALAAQHGFSHVAVELEDGA